MKISSTLAHTLEYSPELAPPVYDSTLPPRDLGTLSTRLAQGLYENVPQLVADLRLVWNNARLYNTGDIISKMAERLATYCESKLKRMNFASAPSELAAEVVSFEGVEDFHFAARELSLHKGDDGATLSPQQSPQMKAANQKKMQVCPR